MNELVNSNKWPRGGMVDTSDSKSLIFGCAGSSPAEATSFYSLQIFNQDKTPDIASKELTQRYVNIKWKKSKPEISKRVKEDKLVESDLFYLKASLPKLFALRNKVIKFKSI